MAIHTIDTPGESPPRAGRLAPVRRNERAAASALAIACLGLLILSASLAPATEGHGTHTQLGLPPCQWAIALGEPCPTCGMTTAFAHAGHGEFLASFLTQPLGFLFALGTSVLFWGALHVATTGSRLGLLAGRLMSGRALALLGVVALAAWAYKLATWSA